MIEEEKDQVTDVHEMILEDVREKFAEFLEEGAGDYEYAFLYESILNTLNYLNVRRKFEAKG